MPGVGSSSALHHYNFKASLESVDKAYRRNADDRVSGIKRKGASIEDDNENPRKQATID